MSNLLGKKTKGGRMSSNWIDPTMGAVVEARTMSHMSSDSKNSEVNDLRNRPASVAMPKDHEMTDIRDA